MGFIRKVEAMARKVAELIRTEGSTLPDLDIEILKNAGSYEKAIDLWSNWLLADFQYLVQFIQNLDKYATVADITSISIKKQQEQILQKCERFAARTDEILITRTMQYTEISKLYTIDILDQKSKEKRDQSARSLQHKFEAILKIINKLASRLYKEGETIKILEQNKDLFLYIQKVETLTWRSMIEGFKKGIVPFRYEK